jgi:6-carboxyhexanoate--CoA ligase
MGNPSYYSVRMHASRQGSHVSGAERIVHEDRLPQTVNLLLARARSKGTTPDQVRISVDDLGQQLCSITPLDLATVPVNDVHQGRSLARQVLLHTGVSRKAIDVAMDLLGCGAAHSGGNMRGAMLIDARSGERLEPDRSRGIRASRFDWTEQAMSGLEQRLASLGLTHFRTREALALATKIAHCPFVAAELCWSDDPDYTAGYAASLPTGYIRFPRMKEPGDGYGGRAIFIRDPRSLVTLISYLEQQPVLIDTVASCQEITDLELYLKGRAGK